MATVTRREVSVGEFGIDACSVEIAVYVEAGAHVGVDIAVHVTDAHEHQQVLYDEDNTRRNGASPKELHRSVERGEPVG